MPLQIAVKRVNGAAEMFNILHSPHTLYLPYISLNINIRKGMLASLTFRIIIHFQSTVSMRQQSFLWPVHYQREILAIFSYQIPEKRFLCPAYCSSRRRAGVAIFINLNIVIEFLPSGEGGGWVGAFIENLRDERV